MNGKSLVFVDLPGYGFAKVAKSEKAKWGSMIEGYLTGSKNLVNVFVLLDVRHEPTSDDKMLLNFLYHYNIPFTVIATKCDKLSRACGDRKRHRRWGGQRLSHLLPQKDGERGHPCPHRHSY